jgi:hypothetical protein
MSNFLQLHPTLIQAAYSIYECIYKVDDYGVKALSMIREILQEEDFILATEDLDFYLYEVDYFNKRMFWVKSEREASVLCYLLQLSLAKLKNIAEERIA